MTTPRDEQQLAEEIAKQVVANKREAGHLFNEIQDSYFVLAGRRSRDAEIAEKDARVKDLGDLYARAFMEMGEEHKRAQRLTRQRDICLKALKWEEKRCGRLHGPLAEALAALEQKEES